MSPASITTAINSSLLGRTISPYPAASPPPLLAVLSRRRRRGTLHSWRSGRISCEAAAAPVTAAETSPSTSASAATGAPPSSPSEAESEALSRVGARVRVKVPVKVYHVQKVPELDLDGMEGEIRQFVGLWKGKRISANLPFKVEFVLPGGGVDSRPGPVKFFAHLREDEFDILPPN